MSAFSSSSSRTTSTSFAPRVSSPLTGHHDHHHQCPYHNHCNHNKCHNHHHHLVGCHHQHHHSNPNAILTPSKSIWPSWSFILADMDGCWVLQQILPWPQSPPSHSHHPPPKQSDQLQIFAGGWKFWVLPPRLPGALTNSNLWTATSEFNARF